MCEDPVTGFRDVSDDYISVRIAACWVDDGDRRPPAAKQFDEHGSDGTQPADNRRCA